MEALHHKSQITHECGTSADKLRSHAAGMLARSEEDERLAAAVARADPIPLRPTSVYCKTWHASLAELSDVDFVDAWRLADYLLVDATAFAEVVVQKRIREQSASTSVHVCLSEAQMRNVHHVETLVMQENLFVEDTYNATFSLMSNKDVMRGIKLPETHDQLILAITWGHTFALDDRPRSNYAGWAAFGGHIHVLEWLRDKGCTFNDDTCTCAALAGRLDVLQWLREMGCAWDGRTCSHAASEGHLNVLQWAMANGCPWDAARCLRLARGKNHRDVVAWIEAQT